MSPEALGRGAGAAGRTRKEEDASVGRARAPLGPLTTDFPGGAPPEPERPWDVWPHSIDAETWFKNVNLFKFTPLPSGRTSISNVLLTTMHILTIRISGS